MNVLSLCDLTTTMVRPWWEAGHDCWCVDLQHPESSRERHPESGATLTRLRADVLTLCTDWLPWDVVFAFPDCTHLAVSGARWMKGKGLGALVGSLRVVDACRVICEQSGARWMLENPRTTLSTYWRRPDHVCNPWQFGGYDGGDDDGYKKETWLWTGGDFVLPPDRAVPIDPETGERIHRAAPGPNRANERSATPEGFARGVYETNIAAIEGRLDEFEAAVAREERRLFA